MYKFILSILVVIVCSMSACAPENPKFTPPVIVKTTLQGQFLHQVYFWLKNPNSQEDVDKLVEGLNTLTQIKTITDYHIGFPAKANREVVDNSYNVSWLLVFDDSQSQDEYQVDSIHLEFVKNYSHLWDSVKVYDSKTALTTSVD